LNRIGNKGAIAAIIVGNIFGIFYLFGRNMDWFEDKTSLIPVYLVLGIVLLYVSIIGIARNRYNLYFGVFGILLSKLTNIPLVFLVNYYTATLQKDTPHKAISKVEIVKDTVKCISIKHGLFTNGRDTIMRLSEDGKQYEVSFENNRQTKYRIKWMDNCSYIVIAESGLVTKHVQLGNFHTNDSHDVYVKPPVIGVTTEESISRYKKIRTSAKQDFY